MRMLKNKMLRSEIRRSFQKRVRLEEACVLSAPWTASRCRSTETERQESITSVREHDDFSC